MAEMILPGTYIEVRAEGLITPGRVTVGNLGVVGTASKGPLDEPTILGSYTEARERFGEYDAWIDGESDELTLVRALELAYAHGATTTYAVRIASSTAKAAEFVVNAGGNPSVTLTANSEGVWGNEIQVQVDEAEENSFIKDEKHVGGAAISLRRTAIVESARNRIRISKDEAPPVQLAVVYAAPAESGQVQIDTATGDLTFFAGEEPTAADEVIASYVVAKADSVEVTLAYKDLEEVYLVPDGEALADAVNEDSDLMTAEAEDPPNSAKPDLGLVSRTEKGANGESGADYSEGLKKLLNAPAHIIVAAGQDGDSFGAQLSAHCKVASSDAIKRERIGVIGSALDQAIDEVLGHDLADGRIIFVAPGIEGKDAAVPPPDNDVTLPGAYAAAAVAGLLAGFPAHRSPTNKNLSVNGLEHEYTSAELTQLVQNRVLALEKRMGFRIVKGITTATNTAWHQITTRRIVDYAKFGVRSAANPYIGRLNNERVRAALQATINSFLTEMVDDEMLISYELEVTATRAEEIKGIVRVTMVLRPVFSIDFIKVTMFLE